MFIGPQQFNFFVSFLRPCFYIFPYFIDAFLWQDIFVIGLFSFGGLGLIDEFIDEFDFPVNESFQYKGDQKITTALKR